MFTLTAALGLALAGSAWCGPAFFVFDETTSPNGRYGFAWGLPEKYTVNWDEVRKGTTDPLDALGDFSEDVENYLVDVKAERILAKLRSAQAWRLPAGAHGNHRDLQVRWSSESDVAVAIYSLKWGYNSFEAFRVIGDEASAPLDIGSPIEEVWRTYLERRAGDRYRSRKDDIVVSFGSIQNESDRIFSAKVYAEIPKSDAREDTFPERRIRFVLSPSRDSGLELKVLGIGKD
jgi:hypothetical protein